MMLAVFVICGVSCCLVATRHYHTKAKFYKVLYETFAEEYKEACDEILRLKDKLEQCNKE